MVKRLITLTALLCLFPVARGQNELKVFQDSWLAYSDAENTLYRYLAKESFRLIDQRESKIAAIKNADDIRSRQDYIRKTLDGIVGPFPEKTPLNAKITGTIDKRSYKIEHIVFESQPGFYVTSSLYLPAGIKKGTRYPAILYCSGHSADGYRSSAYQHVIVNLVKKGFIVYAFDPVGQGERLEYADPATGKSIVGGPTREHSYPGAQAFLTGSSQAMYMIWDGIRAVDYLLSRREVDPSRIGITGRSGGGTQTAYIAAFDDRILASAPENYITNYRRLLETIGPQDAEQNLYQLLAHGLDHPDFLMVRAPRPCLMITTTNDMFSLQGARETEAEIKRIYSILGSEGNFSRVEDYAGHASTQRNREALYSFFSFHLSHACSTKDETADLPSPEELRVTPTGQVSTSFKGETVYSLNLKRAVSLESALSIRRNKEPSFAADAVKEAIVLTGYQAPALNTNPEIAGIISRGSFVVEKYILKPENDYAIPYLLFRPSNPSGEAVIILDPAGKDSSATRGGPAERIAATGTIVLIPDLPGYGENGPGILRGDAYFKGVSHNLWYAAMLCGRTLAGVRAADLTRLAMILRKNEKVNKLSGVATGELTPVLLYSAAFSNLFDSVILNNPSPDHTEIIRTRFYEPAHIMNSVPGALMKYDMADIENYIGSHRVLKNIKLTR